MVTFPLGAAWADITSADSLDDSDQLARHDALDRLLGEPAGAEESWSNIDSGHSGTIRSLSQRPAENGQTCKDLSETVIFGDGQSAGTAVACRIAGGPWRIVTSTLSAEMQQPTSGSDVSQPNGIPTPPVQVWIGMPRGGGAGTTTVTPTQTTP